MLCTNLYHKEREPIRRGIQCGKKYLRGGAKKNKDGYTYITGLELITLGAETEALTIRPHCHTPRCQSKPHPKMSV